MIVLTHACFWMGPKGWVCGRWKLPAPLSEGLGPGAGHSCQKKEPPGTQGLLAHALSVPTAMGGRDGGIKWGCCKEAHALSSSSARAAGASLDLGSGRGEIAELWHSSCSLPSACSHSGPGRTLFQDAKERRPPLYHPGVRHSTATPTPRESLTAAPAAAMVSCAAQGFCHTHPDQPCCRCPLFSLPCSGERPPFQDHLALLHHASSMEMLPLGPAAMQKDCNIRMSLQLCRDLVGPDVLRQAYPGGVPACSFPLSAKLPQFHLCCPGTSPQKSLPHPLS